MKQTARKAIGIAAALALATGLAACSGPAPSGSGANSSASAQSPSPSSPMSPAASASPAAASPSTPSAQTPSNASSPQPQASAPAANAQATTSAPAAETNASTATGTVVTTTYAERAAEVGLAGDDFSNDTGLLTLLVLDSPLRVTAYKGGSDYTGDAYVLCLPNDEMFRQFSGRQITIGADSWGEWPADLTGRLYDLVLDFDADGLRLIDPQ